MQLPDGSPGLDEAKLKLASHFKNLEKHLLSEISSLAGSGFSDKRMCEIAYAEAEKCFMALERALRLGSAHQTDYGKGPDTHHPPPSSFQPRVDPAGARVIGVQGRLQPPYPHHDDID